MLSFKHPKCDFIKALLHFFGHMISPSGVLPDPYKVSSIHDIADTIGGLKITLTLGVYKPR